MGRQGCRRYSAEEAELSAREGSQGPGDWRIGANISGYETAWAAVVANSFCYLGSFSTWNFDRDLLRD